VTQKELIIAYVKENGSILPAKIAGKIYQGYMFGSETSKRCRELRKSGVLRSDSQDRFAKFYLVRQTESLSVEVYKPKSTQELIALAQIKLI
jgi:hypothetical protein